MDALLTLACTVLALIKFQIERPQNSQQQYSIEAASVTILYGEADQFEVAVKLPTKPFFALPLCPPLLSWETVHVAVAEETDSSLDDCLRGFGPHFLPSRPLRHHCHCLGEHIAAHAECWLLHQSLNKGHVIVFTSA